MRKITIPIIILMINSFLLAQPSTAVLEFDVQPYNLSKRALTDRLIIELGRTQKFNIVEREQINHIINEFKLQQTGLTSNQSAVKIGRLLNVEQIIIGSVGSIETSYTKYYVNARIVDVESGKTIKTATFDKTGDPQSLLDYGMRNIAYQLAGIILPGEQKNPSPYKTEEMEKSSVPIKSNPLKNTVGFEYDILSQFRNGNSFSVWVGGGNYGIGIRFRGQYSQKDVPQVFYRDGFTDGRVNNAYSIFLDVTQDRFNGFWGGLGLAYLNMHVGHKEEQSTVDYEMGSLAFSFGIITKMVGNLYLNFWIDSFIFIIGDKEFKVGKHNLVHDDLGLDFSVAVGFHF